MLCNQCGVNKPINEFLFRKDRGTIRKPCKQCIYSINRKWAKNNPEKAFIYQKIYQAEHRLERNKKSNIKSKTPRSKEVRKKWYQKKMKEKDFRIARYESQKKWREENPIKKRAHDIVRLHVSSGKIKSQPCVKCGSDKSSAHHEDYRKPLEIIWFCHSCHMDHHSKKRKNVGIVLNTQFDPNTPLIEPALATTGQKISHFLL